MVVLNACYTEAQASVITGIIECTVGMSNDIGDDAAIAFAGTFYGAIAYGKSVQTVFDQAKAALMLQNISEEMIPVLHTQDGELADKVVLI